MEVTLCVVVVKEIEVASKTENELSLGLIIDPLIVWVLIRWLLP